jgi:hypothetical protein
VLNKLMTVAILLGIGYFIVTQAGPWLRRQTGGFGQSDSFEDDGGASYCVDLAFAANDSLGDSMRRFGRPPVDLDQWSNALWEVESAINDASNSCTCPSDACSTANQALGEMREQISALDDLIRGTAAGYANPATRQERIVDLLYEARSWV